MINPKVSVIIPVYNVEKYISKCLNSVVNQTYKNIEIVIVDDGSKDNSGVIVDNFASNDKRVVVLHKENAGVSAARNDGLRKSTGEYVVFVDSDDYLELDFIEYYISIIVDTNADVVCGLKHFSIWNRTQSSDFNYSGIDRVKAMRYIYLEKINVAVWNKIYSKELILNSGVEFDESIWYGEGMLFNIEIFQAAENIVVSNKMVYHQIFNPDSAMRDFNLNSNLCGLRSLNLQKTKWKISDPKLENAWNYHYWYFNFSILKGLIKMHMVKSNKELYIKCKKELKKYALAPLKTDLSTKRKLVDMVISHFPYFAAKIFILKDKIACVRANAIQY